MNHKFSSIGITLILSFLSLIFANQSQGQEKINEVSKFDIEINYIGSTNEYLSFEVKIPQSVANRLVFKITDEDGVDLYREFINGKAYNKTILVARSHYEQLDFTTSSEKIQVKKSYFIKSEIIEKVKVTSKTTR
jgi:hypothetical protein